MLKISRKKLEHLRERLASLEHEQWSSAAEYIINNISFSKVRRWQRQINTDYEMLSESEKNSDREWANRVIGILIDIGVI